MDQGHHLTRARPPVAPKYFGMVDGLTDHAVSGYVVNLRDMDRHPVVQVIHGSKLVGTALCDQFRDDLLRKGAGDGRCGFSVPLGKPLRASMHALKAVVIDDDGGEHVILFDPGLFPAHEGLAHVPTPVADPIPCEGPAQLWRDTPMAGVHGRLRCEADGLWQAGRWLDAQAIYLKHLETSPDDTLAWQRLGDCAREQGDLVNAEGAHRVAALRAPCSAAAHLAHGDALKALGRLSDAGAAYQRSFTLRPSLAAGTRAEALGCALTLAPDVAAPRLAALCLEVSDLLHVMAEQRHVSGIQRVQLALVSHVLRTAPPLGAPHPVLAIWGGDRLYALAHAALARLLDSLRLPAADLQERRWLIQSLRDEAALFQPQAGDVVLSTGATWIPDVRGEVTQGHSRLKRAGVRLGMYVYDLIPLTNPEYCHPYLTERFSVTLAETLLHCDFALTISAHVVTELTRALDRAGYPAIPTRPVPLPHSFNDTRQAEAVRPASADVPDEEYVLAVSSVSAHKNHTLLFYVWQILSQDMGNPPLLIIVGKRGYGSDDLFRQLEASHFLDGRIRVLEDVSDETLSQLYDGCMFTIFPSFIEGWGLPVGESLAHGKLCLASSTASMPEVGGDFALYIDPYNARGCAEAVASLLADRPALHEHETRIRQSFQARTWEQFGEALLRHAWALGRATRSPLPSLTLGFNRVVQPCAAESGWTGGTRLPPRGPLAERTLRRIVLASGWVPPDRSGAWMSGAAASLVIPTEASPGEMVTAALQLRVEASGPAVVHVGLTSSCGGAIARTLSGAGDLCLCLQSTADASGHIELRVIATQDAVLSGHPARVALVRLMVAPPSERFDQVPAYQLLRTASLSGAPGVAMPPCSRSLLVSSLRKTAVLTIGWQAPGALCTWMDGPAAHIHFGVQGDPGSIVRVALQLRGRPHARLRVTATAACGATATVSPAGEKRSRFMLWLDCAIGHDGRISVTLKAIEPDAPPNRIGSHAPLGIAGLAYGEHSALLMQSLLFPPPEPDLKHEIFAAGLRFTVTGHIKGSYSLAAVNRRLALALEEHSPGAVRLEQVEGTPVRDLSDIPAADRQALAPLACRPPHSDGPEVLIAQHWPVLATPPAADLKLAFVFWEESLVPQDMVRQLNSSYAGVLVPTRSVAKALVDSGVALPVRTIGMAPNLHPFAALAEQRAAGGRPNPSKANPFTFLHVSSCFPRKGADVLLRAFAQAFGAEDPVRLVIKTFPNPHNDVVQQLQALRTHQPGVLDIDLINHDLPFGQLLDLYRTADAMVLPTRGEGFNLPAAEAMAAGLPLIVTGFGGHADFANPTACRSVEYRFAPSGTHLNSPGSVWAEPDAADLAAAMREAFSAAGTEAASARLRASRAAAAILADASAWAQRITAAAADVLCTGKPAPPRLAVVTTWKVRCGIAEYCRMLLDDYPDAVRDVTVLCNDAAATESENARHPPAVVAWRNQDPSSMERLACAISETDARVVLVQHHFSLIGPLALTRLLVDRRLASRHFVVILHNVQDLFGSDPPMLERLRAALATVSRILVHTVRDLNLLKAHSLVGNVTLFPHGATAAAVPARPPRALPPAASPLIGAYGFMLPHKNFAKLIRAFVGIRQEWPAARLRLVTAEYPDPSSAAELARCRTLAASLGLDSAIEWHTEYLPDGASLSLLNECDLVVLPYEGSSESSSASVRQAIASRTPVAVTPVPIFDDVERLVFRFDGTDVLAITNGVIWILKEPNARRHMQDSVAAWLAANSWKVVGERLQGMLTGIVAQEGGGAVG